MSKVTHAEIGPEADVRQPAIIVYADYKKDGVNYHRNYTMFNTSENEADAAVRSILKQKGFTVCALGFLHITVEDILDDGDTELDSMAAQIKLHQTASTKAEKAEDKKMLIRYRIYDPSIVMGDQ